MLRRGCPKQIGAAVPVRSVAHVRAYANATARVMPALVPPDLSNPTQDRPLFVASCILLATYFYEIPVLTTPWGMLTWIRLDDLAMIPLLLAAVFSRQLSPGIGTTRTGKLITIALILMPISVLLTFVTTFAFQATLRALWTMGKFVEYFVVFLLVSRLRIDRYRLQVFMAIALIGTALNGLVGIAQFYGLMDPARLYRIFLSDPHFLQTASFHHQVATGEWDRALGFFTTNYMLMGLFMCLGLVLTVLSFAAPVRLWLRALALGAFAPIIAGLALSGSRTAMVMAVAFLVLYTLLGRRRVLGIVALLVGLGVAVFVLQRAETIFERLESARTELAIGGGALGGGRIWLYRANIIHMFSHPEQLLWGYGMSTWAYKMRPLLGFSIPHSNYTLVLTEFGLVGAILWATIQISLLFLLLTKARQATNRLAQSFARTLLALHLTVLLGCLTYEILTPWVSSGSLMGYYQFWLAAGLAVCRNPSEVPPVYAPRRTYSRNPVSLVRPRGQYR